MLSYKDWLETRWRFWIGLALLSCSAGAVVFEYPQVIRLLRQLPALDMGGEIGRRIDEAVKLSQQFKGYVWSQALRQNLTQLGTLFAVLLGTGGLLSQRAALFTLSLPVSRNRLIGNRALVGLLEWLALAMLPPLLIPILAPAIGESYGFADALVHGLCLFLAGSVFFSLAVFFSTIFGDVWRPLLIGVVVAMVAAISEQFVGGLSRFSLFRVMSGEAWFREGRLPWLGLLASAALSGALLYGAAAQFRRRDF